MCAESELQCPYNAGLARNGVSSKLVGLRFCVHCAWRWTTQKQTSPLLPRVGLSFAAGRLAYYVSVSCSSSLLLRLYQTGGLYGTEIPTEVLSYIPLSRQ